MPKETLLANLELHVMGPFNLARLSAAAFAENEPGRRRPAWRDRANSVDQRVRRPGDDGSVRGGQGRRRRYDAADGTRPAPIGVRVCAIAPGAFATPRLSSPQAQALLLEDIVFPKRLGQPDEYALLAEAIIRNPYLNGEVIRLDGATRLSSEMAPRRRHGPRERSFGPRRSRRRSR